MRGRGIRRLRPRCRLARRATGPLDVVFVLGRRPVEWMVMWTESSDRRAAREAAWEWARTCIPPAHAEGARCVTATLGDRLPPAAGIERPPPWLGCPAPPTVAVEIASEARDPLSELHPFYEMARAAPPMPQPC